MAASVTKLRLRVAVALVWVVVGLVLLSNYTWEHFPAPTCEHPGQLDPKYLLCPGDDAPSGTGLRLSDSPRGHANAAAVPLHREPSRWE